MRMGAITLSCFLAKRWDTTKYPKQRRIDKILFSPPCENRMAMIIPLKNPTRNTRAPGASTDAGQALSEPWQIQAGQEWLSGQAKLGAQDKLGHGGQPGVAQMAKAVDTPLASSGTISGNRCAKYILPKCTASD